MTTVTTEPNKDPVQPVWPVNERAEAFRRPNWRELESRMLELERAIAENAARAEAIRHNSPKLGPITRNKAPFWRRLVFWKDTGVVAILVVLILAPLV